MVGILEAERLPGELKEVQGIDTLVPSGVRNLKESLAALKVSKV